MLRWVVVAIVAALVIGCAEATKDEAEMAAPPDTVISPDTSFTVQ